MPFQINRVYTRSGDDGSTGLVNGQRVSKASSRVSAYGELDELNSLLGFLKEAINSNTVELCVVVEKIQQQLFDLGAELATLSADRPRKCGLQKVNTCRS